MTSSNIFTGEQPTGIKNKNSINLDNSILDLSMMHSECALNAIKRFTYYHAYSTNKFSLKMEHSKSMLSVLFIKKDTGCEKEIAMAMELLLSKIYLYFEVDPYDIEYCIKANRFKKKGSFPHFAKLTDNINMISYRLSDIESPSRTNNEDFAIYLDRWNEQHANSISHLSTVNSVNNIFLHSFLECELTIDKVANSLKMSRRTLHRRLQSEGVTYGELMDNYKRNLAISMLRQSTYKLIDISCYLGFKSQSNFTRAFKRWTGLPPKKYRDNLDLM